MSNQYLKLRRSAVPSRVPSTSSLDFGEIALNTYDGLAYMKRSGSSGIEEVIPIGSIPIPTNEIITGYINASVNPSPENLFLIKSSSVEYFNISASSNTELYSNLFIIKNFDTKQPVLTVSQSIVQFATQSIDPTGTTLAGSIWFTSASFYVGLEDT